MDRCDSERRKIKLVKCITNENKIKETEEIVYKEWVPSGRFIKIIMLALFLLIISIGIIIIAFLPEELVFIGTIFGALSLFIVLLYWNFRGLQIILTKNELEVNYGVFNHKKIQLRDISGCEETKARFKRYGGIGIRLGLDGSWAYTIDFGEAVKIILRKGRSFVFSTRNSKKICKLLNELVN